MGQQHHYDHNLDGDTAIEQQFVCDLLVEHLAGDDPVHVTGRQELMDVTEDDVHQEEDPECRQHGAGFLGKAFVSHVSIFCCLVVILAVRIRSDVAPR